MTTGLQGFAYGPATVPRRVETSDDDGAASVGHLPDYACSTAIVAAVTTISLPLLSGDGPVVS